MNENMKAKQLGRGLSWRSLMAILFSAIVIQPAVIYLYLVTGEVFPLYGWIAILLWVEMARALGAPLSKQEAFIISTFGGLPGYAMAFLDPIINMYIGTTGVAEAFGIAKVIPSWWAPPPSAAYNLYFQKWVFLNPIWIGPISIMLITTLFAIVANISIGYFCYELYVTVEKLAFPAATAEADTMSTLSEREPDKTRVLLLSALAGIIYNVVVGLLPSILGGSVTFLIDFTMLMYQSLPGATLAFTTSLLAYIPGFLLPIRVCVAQLMGAISFYLVGTHLITRFGLWPAEAQPQTLSTWAVSTVEGRADLYFYTSATIGLSLAVATIPFILHPRTLAKAFGKLAKAKGPSEREGPNLYMLLAMFIAASVGSIILVSLLAPGFSIWLLLLYTVGWSFFASFISTASSGITYGSLSIPYQKELMIFSSGYPYRDIWFAPVQTFTGGAGICQKFKQADILGAKHSDYIKAYIIVVSLSLLSSFLYVSFFWYIQPFPAGNYPSTIVSWPIRAMDFSRMQTWIWTGYLFRYEWIAGAFVIGAVTYAVTDLVFHFPGFLISFLIGPKLGTGCIAFAVAQLVGSILANKVLAPFVGRESWRKYRNLMVTGLLLGSGFVSTLLAAITLIRRSMWLLPY